MSLLSLGDLSVTHPNGRAVLHDVSVEIGPNELVGLVGPNGAGKTTLMRAALGLIPFRGRSSLAEMKPAARGRQAAWMPQAREIAWPVSVETLVALGRTPHLGLSDRLSDADRGAVDAALAELGLDAFRSRTATQLSGGEQARVLLARALAQETPLLLADEPIAGLDPAHQISTMQTFARLAAQGRAIVVSLHDLGLAARHCTRLIALKDGRVVADGAPATVLTSDLMGEVFGVRAYYELTPQGPVFQPLEVVE